jgi:orotidine-5'-phosphate decarboxylase
MRPLLLPQNRIYAAIDSTDLAAAAALIAQLSSAVGGIKLGLEFFCAHGAAGVRQVLSGHHDLPLFLDLKLHDIPNTVAGAMRAVAALQPRFVTLHASGGPAMLAAARQAAEDEAIRRGFTRPRLLAVTVLTSLDAADLAAVGQPDDVAGQVVRLARMAQAAGVDGIVCSPHEVSAVRAACGEDFALMVPGVRPAWATSGDQKRVTSPAEALAAGADYLVIGRPLTMAADPAAAARLVLAELQTAA